MIQLENCLVDLNEIWYGHYSIWDYCKIILLDFIQLVIPTWQRNKLGEVLSTLVPLAVISKSDVWL
jgi:hypothetical protein